MLTYYNGCWGGLSKQSTYTLQFLLGAPSMKWAGPNARPRRWATYEQWFYGVIVFSQPCYDCGRAQICNTALTRELSTFANVREEISWFWRERSLLPMKFICRFYWILKRKVYLAKMNNLPKDHGAGPQRRGAQCSCIGCIGLRPALPQSSWHEQDRWKRHRAADQFATCFKKLTDEKPGVKFAVVGTNCFWKWITHFLQMQLRLFC